MRDGYTLLSASLHPPQAEMLRVLLESAGIECLVEDAAAASMIGDVVGARVIVREADNDRARELAAESGFLGDSLASPASAGAWGIHGSAAPHHGDEDAPKAVGLDAASRRALGVAVVAVLLAPTVVFPLLALAFAFRLVRVRRTPRAYALAPASREARRRITAALCLGLVSVALAFLFWAKIVPLFAPRG